MCIRDSSWIGSFLGMPPMNLVSSSDLGDSISPKKGTSVVGIRPENLTVSSEKSKLSGSVISTEYLGDSKILNVQVGNSVMKVKVSNDSTFSVGANVNLDFSDDDLRFFTDDGKNIG